MDNYNDTFISKNISIFEALKLMDKIDIKLLIVLDKSKFFSLLSIGDIQRALLKNYTLETPIYKIVREKVRVANEQLSLDEIKNMMITYRMEFCPVIDSENNIKNVYFWDDIFQGKNKSFYQKFNLPVVIMAGGFGTRMKPLTNVIPKPLIPIGDCSILEHIMKSFHDYGCQDFHVSVNYKADLIEYYLNQQN